MNMVTHIQNYPNLPTALKCEKTGEIANVNNVSLTLQHPTAPPKVWGAAYRIPASHVAAAKHLLDIREINGYTVHTTPFHQADMTVTYQTVHTSSSTATTNPSSASKVVVPDKIQCLLYIGLPTNPQFVGPQDPQALAEHIMRSRGPSGENREYLYQLGEALEGLSDESGDEHVRDLIRRCREIEARERG